jgi:hypothetical protein
MDCQWGFLLLVGVLHGVDPMMIAVPHRGRTPTSHNVPRSAYPEIVRRQQSGLECAADIGRAFGIRPQSVRSLVKRCREHPELLEVPA